MRKEFEFEGAKYYIKAPSPKINQKASKIYALEFTKNLEYGLKSMEEMREFLVERKVFTKDDEKEEEAMIEKINQLERELYLGGPEKKKYHIEEGKQKA